MQFPESWLRTFVDPQLTTEQLSHALTMAGLEVEDLRPVAPPTSKIVVGRVLEVVKHPDADKLNVCQVDAGTGATLNIVCGAPNVAPGIKVPVALVGAQLPPAEEGGAQFAIRLSKLRGVESQGMLCSARELKLSEDHSGLLILPEDTPIGQDIRETLKLDDTIFEIKLTPNKADCLSVFGVARETAAITGAPLKPVEIKPAPVALSETLPVKISAPDLCGRFSGRVIRGVNARAKSPQWMVERLERSGQRSISALVDITNFLTLDVNRLTAQWADISKQVESVQAPALLHSEPDLLIKIVRDGTPAGMPAFPQLDDASTRAVVASRASDIARFWETSMAVVIGPAVPPA